MIEDKYDGTCVTLFGENKCKEPATLIIKLPHKTAWFPCCEKHFVEWDKKYPGTLQQPVAKDLLDRL